MTKTDSFILRYFQRLSFAIKFMNINGKQGFQNYTQL